jgi:lipopolysaccharide export system permease protein
MTSKFRMSRILFHYFGREFAVPLLCCLVGFIAMFIIIDLLDFLQDFISVQAPIRQVMLFFLIRQPVNLINILPMAILLSVCYLLNTMTRHNELTAVRASGISIPTCARPIWLLATLLSLATFGINEYAIPICKNRSEAMLKQLTEPEEASQSQARQLAFRNRAQNRDWLFERFSRTGEQQGILIKQFRPDRSLEWVLRARHGIYQNKTWSFRDVALTHFTNGSPLPDAVTSRHDTYADPTLNESPAEIIQTLQPAESLSVLQLYRLLRQDPNLPRAMRDIYLTTLWYRLAFPFSCLMAAILGIAFSITEERRGALSGFAKALGMMMLYYGASQLFLLLGKTGRLPPLIGGTLPLLALSAWGAIRLHRKQ